MVYMLGRIIEENDLIVLDRRFNEHIAHLTKRDIIIMFCDRDIIEDDDIIEWLDKRNFTSLIIDGDEGGYKIFRGRRVTEYMGLGVHQLSSRVYYAANSGVLCYNKKKILIGTLGKASQVLDGFSYYNLFLKQSALMTESVRQHDNTVDVVVTRFPPHIVSLRKKHGLQFDFTSMYYNELYNKVKFKRWYSCGLGYDDLRDPVNKLVSKLITPIL